MLNPEALAQGSRKADPLRAVRRDSLVHGNPDELDVLPRREMSWRRTAVVLLSFPPESPTATRSPPRNSTWARSSRFTRRSTNSRKWPAHRCCPLYRIRVTAGDSHFEQCIGASIAGQDIRLRPSLEGIRKMERRAWSPTPFGSAHPPWIVNMIIAGDPEAVRVNPFSVYWTLRFAVTVEPLGAFT